MATVAKRESAAQGVRRWAALLLAAGAVVLGAGGCKAAPAKDASKGDEGGKAAAPAPVFFAGAASADITPEIKDAFEDSNGNGEYEPELGEKAIDRNGDGRIEFVYLAGYGSPRPATRVLDRLRADAVVWEAGGKRMAIVGVDSMGIPYRDLKPIIKRCRDELGIAAMAICASHSHATPDAFGMWGEREKSGRSEAYMDFLRDRVFDAVRRATAALVPASLAAWQEPAPEYIVDDRRPKVIDDALTVLHFTTPDGGRTIATLINWSNHPDALGPRSTALSADFVHALREGVEKGLTLPSGEKHAGLGGVAVYTTGSVGGQIEPSDPATGEGNFAFTDKDNVRAAQRHTRKIGRALAAHVHRMMLSGMRHTAGGPYTWNTDEFEIPVENARFRALQKRGMLPAPEREGFVVSTVAGIHLGPAHFIAVPGEIYPEIIRGGIETPPGADFPVSPVEIPPLKEKMRGPVRVVLGLANDEIGYIIPRSEWDDADKPPFLYGARSSPYGEVNSLGPSAAPLIHRRILKLLEAEAKAETQTEAEAD